MAVMVGNGKKFMNDNSGEFDAGGNTELPLLKFLPLTYHHSHFLATTHIFFTLPFLEPAPFFTAWLVFDYMLICTTEIVIMYHFIKTRNKHIKYQQHHTN